MNTMSCNHSHIKSPASLLVVLQCKSCGDYSPTVTNGKCVCGSCGLECKVVEFKSNTCTGHVPFPVGGVCAICETSMNYEEAN